MSDNKKTAKPLKGGGVEVAANLAKWNREKTLTGIANANMRKFTSWSSLAAQKQRKQEK